MKRVITISNRDKRTCEAYTIYPQTYYRRGLLTPEQS